MINAKLMSIAEGLFRIGNSCLSLAVFWDIKTQFVPHRKHITSPLQRAAS
jgi:hypothetical protein